MAKRILFFLGLIILSVGCAKVSEVENLQRQIDELKSDQIASINAQMAGISLSLGNLQTVDNELRGYIQTLQQQKETLEQADQDLDQAIKDLRTELSGDITAAEANALAQLEAYKSTVAGQISSINAAITALQNKDADLQQQITTLKNYVENDLKAYIDNGDQSTKDWVTATFVTLDQFNTTAEIVAGIQGQIAGINQEVSRIANSKIGHNELEQAINDLDTSLQQKIRQSVSDCSNAVAAATQAITEAYTTAIQEAISDSEGAMKTWVNNQLSGYYTIAQTDAKIASLETMLKGQLDAQKTYLEGLINGLEAGLSQKINTNSSLIEGLQSQISGLSGELTELSATVVENSRQISENAGAIAANARNIATNASDIGACELLIAENKRLIGENAASIGENARAITSILGRVTSNEQNIADNAVDIAGNADDIARNASLISSNATAISKNARAISDNALDIAQLRADLSTARTEITEAYQNAISTAITSLDGKLSDRIAAEVETLNGRIDREVASVTAILQALSSRVDACESDIALIKETISTLREDINAINGNISTINQQITNILESISDLNSMDTAINGYIETLRGQLNQLNGDYADLSSQIEGIRGQLAEQSAATAAVLAQLEAYKTTANAQIQSLQQAIARLEAADAEIREEISTLRSYIDTEIANSEDWASATFSTLEQFNGLSDLVAGIKTDVEALQSGLAQTNQTLTSTKEELVTMISGLDQTMQQRIQQLTTSFNQALQDTYDTVTEEYRVAITSAIQSLESSMKAWVNEQLAGYYTIAETDAKLAALRSALEGQLNGQKSYLEGLIQELETVVSTQNDLTAQELTSIRQLITTNQGLIADNAETIAKNEEDIAALQSSLVQAKQEITSAYQQAIATAISTLEGQMTGRIESEVSAINSRINSEIATVNATLESITDRVAACENDILEIKNTILSLQQDIADLQEQVEAILARIQSLTFVPEYSSGEVAVNYSYDGTVVPGVANFIFEVHPASAAADLAQVSQAALSMKAVYTITRAAPDLVPLDIIEVTADSGFLTITVSGNALKEDFFLRRCSASASLLISDGISELASDYIPLIPITEDIIVFNDVNLKDYMVANFDKNGDGEISHSEACDIQKVNCPNASISDATGLEHLMNLKYLNISGNAGITALSTALSATLETLNVANTSLTEIDLSNYPSLVDLDISSTPITALDLSANALLKDLNISDTPFKSTVPIGYDLSIGVVFCNSGSVVKIISKDESRQQWGYVGVTTDAFRSWSDGMGNTNSILAGSPAAQWCRAKGDDWYLPARDELSNVDEVLTEVNACLSSLGCKMINTNSNDFMYWSSSETSAEYAAVFDFGSHHAVNYGKHHQWGRVRAIRAL